MKNLRNVIQFFDASLLMGVALVLMASQSNVMSNRFFHKKEVKVVSEEEKSEMKIKQLLLTDHHLTNAIEERLGGNIKEKKSNCEIINIQKNEIRILKDKIYQCELKHDSLMTIK